MNNNENKIKATHVIFQLIVFAALVAAGTAAYMFFMKNKPEVKKRGPKEARPVYVDVKEFKPGKASLIVNAMGEISPEKEVNLKPFVSGEIIKVSKNFYPGGIVKKGEILIEIDKRDYLFDVKKKEAALKKYQASLDLELGKQKSAAKELEFYEKAGVDKVEDKSLALRKPQLDSAQADIDSAMSDLDKAKLDLLRTTIKAPFDAIIVETNVNIGSNVSSQESLALIYGIDKYRVKAYVPADKTGKINNKKKKIDVNVYSQTSGIIRKGYVKSFTGKVSETSRMAEVLIDIDDPLGLKNDEQPLISGDYVSLEIITETIEDIISIPREYIRDNEYIYLYNDEKLEIRKIDILWKNSKDVLVKKGVNPKDKIITSSISTPVENIPLVLNNDKKKPGMKKKGMNKNEK
jgi:RND family efflux transporter MFP subunit